MTVTVQELLNESAHSSKKTYYITIRKRVCADIFELRKAIKELQRKYEIDNHLRILVVSDFEVNDIDFENLEAVVETKSDITIKELYKFKKSA